MAEIIGVVLVSIIMLRMFAAMSIIALSPWSPVCRRDKLVLDVPGTTTRVTRKAVVKRGLGRVARVFRDDKFGFQHTVIVWGLMRCFPTRMLKLMYFQVELEEGTKRTFQSVSLFPCSHVHLIDFPQLTPGDYVDLAGAQIVEICNESGSISGARDLRTWKHQECAWLAPAGADLAALSLFSEDEDAQG